VPITTLSTQLNEASYFINSYPKPALAYLYVKDLLGDELFKKALHYYISQWHGKHPVPFDFFNCINTGSGKNLNWFWKRWFFEPGFPDLRISKVNLAGKHAAVTIEMLGNKPTPINLTVYYNDNTFTHLHQNISCWEKDNKTFTINFTYDLPIKKIVLGDLHDPDVDASNNIFNVK